jgi:hypothetical protein
LRLFRRKPRQPGIDAIADQLRAQHDALEEVLSSLDPRLFDAPLAQYLKTVFREDEPPLSPQILEALGDLAVSRAAETGDSRFMNWVEATFKSAASALCLILRDARPFPAADNEPSQGAITRAISVIGSRHLDMYLEAQDWQRLGKWTKQELAVYVLSAIDPFGASFFLWLPEREDRIRKQGGRPHPTIATLDGLRAALWQTDLQEIPLEADDLDAVLGPHVPGTGVVVPAGADSTATIAAFARLYHLVEQTIVITCVLDFAPRLKRLMESGAPARNLPPYMRH